VKKNIFLQQSSSQPQSGNRIFSLFFLRAFVPSCLSAFFFFSCAAYTDLEPVGKGQRAVTASLGGPVIKAFGLHIPTPYLATGAVYGLDDNINVSGAFHFTSLAYGILGIDPALTFFPMLNYGPQPTLGIRVQMLTFISLKSGVSDRMRVYPVITPSAAWRLGHGRLYGGLNITIPVSLPDYDKSAAYMIYSPFAGYRWELTRHFRLTTEFKWHGSNVRSDQMAVTYNNNESTGIKYGALTPLIGVEWLFK
jgi:hypothetical protein